MAKLSLALKNISNHIHPLIARFITKQSLLKLVTHGGAPDWKISDKTFDSLVVLAVDATRRNDIKKWIWTDDKRGNIHDHSWYASTICMGLYLRSKMPELARRANHLLSVGDAATSTVLLRVHS